MYLQQIIKLSSNGNTESCEPIVLIKEKDTHLKLAIVDIDQVGNNPDLIED